MKTPVLADSLALVDADALGGFLMHSLKLCDTDVLPIRSHWLTHFVMR